MNRLELQSLAKKRVKESKALLDNGFFEGAYYLLGYAIECAFKACIAKQIKRYDFPDKRFVNDSYTHNLEKLLEVSGLKIHYQKEIRSNSQLELNWAIVKDWSEEVRYSSSIPEAKVRDFYLAVTARNGGILTWIKRLW